MWRGLTMHLDWRLLLAQAEQPREARRQLDPVQRLQLLSALALVVILGATAILVIRATGRLVRWYGHDKSGDRRGPDADDWAQKPLAPPLDDLEDETANE